MLLASYVVIAPTVTREISTPASLAKIDRILSMIDCVISPILSDMVTVTTIFTTCGCVGCTTIGVGCTTIGVGCTTIGVGVGVVLGVVVAAVFSFSSKQLVAFTAPLVENPIGHGVQSDICSWLLVVFA